MNDPKSFLSALFDMSFSSFIIPKILRVLFVIGIAFAGLGAFIFLVSSLVQGSIATILVGLVGAPIMFLLYVILLRVYFELLLVFFSLRENVQRLTDHITGGSGPSAGGPVDGRGIVHSPSGGGATPSPIAAPSPAAAPAPTPAATPTPAQTPPSSTDGGGGGGGGGWS